MGLEEIFTEVFVIGVLTAGLRLATPILLASLGETLAERSGVVNLGIEGVMQVAALSAFVVVFLGGDLWLGLAVAGIIGVVFGLIHAVVTVTIRIDQIVAGVAIWVLGWGLASFLFRAILGEYEYRPHVEGFPNIYIPFLSDIPYIGPIIFQQNAITYLGLALVAVTTFILYKTNFGLKTRAVGEIPKVADVLGINVTHVRYLCIMYGTLLAGFAGAYFSIAQINIFVDNVSAGRGFVAVALATFGRWDPRRVLIGALLFGIVDGLQWRLQAIFAQTLPFQYFLMLPYVITIIFLVWVGKKAIAPMSINVPYKRGEA